MFHFKVVVACKADVVLFSVVAGVSVHSYGNVLIMPWGYDDVAHDDQDQLSRLAYKMVNAVKWNTKDRELYVPGTAYQV